MSPSPDATEPGASRAQLAVGIIVVLLLLVLPTVALVSAVKEPDSDERQALWEPDCEPGEAVGVATGDGAQSERVDPEQLLRRDLPMIQPSDDIEIVGTTDERTFAVRRGERVVLTGELWGNDRKGWIFNNVTSCSSVSPGSVADLMDGWVRFSDKAYDVSFSYPHTWETLESELDSFSFSDGIVWAGSVTLRDPCETTRRVSSTEVSCSNRAFRTLGENDQAIYLQSGVMNPGATDEEPWALEKGRPIEVAGRRAKLEEFSVTDDPARADRGLRVVIDRGDRQLFVLQAWWRGPDLARGESIVNGILETLRLTPVGAPPSAGDREQPRALRMPNGTLCRQYVRAQATVCDDGSDAMWSSSAEDR